ncbi:MAG: transporter substrate-binding domain-containing protein [Christensenellaceae bacterium]
MGFRKDDQKLHDQVMGALAEMKADGTSAQISNKWFGRDVTL